MMCVQFTSKLPLRERRITYILRVLTDFSRVFGRTKPLNSGIWFSVVPVSVSAEQCETASASHSPTSCDPILNPRRIAKFIL